MSSGTALITGARRGIGAATAVALSEAGLHVVLAVRDPDGCAGVLDRIRALGGSARAIRCDVRRWDAVQACASELCSRHVDLRILVNNAGTLQPTAHAADSDPGLWAESVEVNLLGAYYWCRALLPAFLRNGRSTIINMSSGAAFRPLEGWSAYCCSKAALAMLTCTLAVELAGKDVFVYGLQPGMVNTEAVHEAFRTPINRITSLDPQTFADPREPAIAIRWLCQQRPEDLVGREVLLTDADFRRRVGLGD